MQSNIGSFFAIFTKLNKEYSTNFTLEDPFKILITTVLSQRTQDKNTHKSSKQLFSVFKTPEDIARAEEKEIQDLIKPSGFYKVKAKRIKEISKIVYELGHVPDNLNDLLELPGVGRKTANCVLAYAYGKKVIIVDTLVHRISNRLGLVNTKTPEQTEMELMKVIPKKYWKDINKLFVQFGQTICRPINPKCSICPIKDLCLYHVP